MLSEKEYITILGTYIIVASLSIHRLYIFKGKKMRKNYSKDGTNMAMELHA